MYGERTISSWVPESWGISERGHVGNGGVWAVSLLYTVFGLTFYINGVGDAALSLISSIACAGITIAHKTILCATTGATAPKQFMCRLLLIYTWIAPGTNNML
ncbi:hypothetical protein B0H14DRAFT_2921209, partial [Mycena olivaceomarginata]